MCAAYVLGEFRRPSVKEAKAVKTAYGQAEEQIDRVISAACFHEFINSPCTCNDCTKRNEGIKYSQDGDKICAVFEDFVNLQESPAGFGDTEEEAKADLLKNASASF